MKTRPFRKTYTVGQVYGRLTYLGHDRRDKLPSGQNKRYALFRCACGNEREYQLSNVLAGNSSQCEDCRRKALGGTVRKFAGDLVNRKQALRAYQRNAKKRGLSWNLSLEDFDKITAQECFYCGSPPSNIYHLKHKSTGLSRSGDPFVYSGIDRINSSDGYLPGNVLPCCRLCNMAKQQYTMPEFVAWVARLANRLQEYENGTRMAPRSFGGEEVWREARRLLSNF